MKFFSIRNKIFLFYTCFIMILLSLVGYVLYSLFFDTLKEYQINYSIELANKTQYNLEFFLSTVNNTAALLSNNSSILAELSSGNGENKEEIDKFLETTVSAHAYLKGVYIIGQNGNVYVSDQRIKAEDLAQSFENIISNESGDGFYKDSYTYKYHSSYNARTLTYSKHIYDYKNHIDYGLLIIAINYDFLRELISTASVTLVNKMLVVDPEGETLFTFPFNAYLDEVIFKHPEVLSETNLRFTDKVFGEESIIVSDTIKYSNWKIISIHPLNNILQDIRNLFVEMVKMIAMFFIVTAFFAYLFSYSITKPIITLRRSMKLVEKGNLDVNVDVINNDEIGELTAAFNRMVMRIDQLIKRTIENEKQKAEMDFKILQAQINPHFLYNTLDSIRWMATLQNAPIVSTMTSSMINLLKYNFSRKDTLVSLSEEIDSVKNYVSIQKYKYGDVFDIVYHIPEEILEYKTIKFILQPIVENSIFHGFENIEHIGLIEISAYAKEDHLYIKVSDNGVGMTEEQKENLINRKPSNQKYLEIGIKNVDDRIKFYCGEDSGLTLVSELNIGTTVTFKLPLNINM
ncbi:sensor histidine kinase [Anoxybacterium hadale]|uniref:Sensor histidine kinase n=1 Tax=Anoxybacterium hadale TaxID=3408580 RepID=A0ACD1A8S5_9FIRM|nr:sensor histidine kinase [Clostridiales bacterium]